MEYENSESQSDTLENRWEAKDTTVSALSVKLFKSYRSIYSLNNSYAGDMVVFGGRKIHVR